MKLKVICQRCGKTEEIETSEHNVGWTFYKTTNLIPLIDYLDWEVWFCGECNYFISKQENVEVIYRNIFQPTEGELS